MATVFERPLGPGWVYLCSAADIREQLERLPPEDLAGLTAVGPVPSTRKDCSANARYFCSPYPVIYVYSHPDTLSYKLPPHTSSGRAEVYWIQEREFGMRLEPVGARLVCRWEPEDLRRFILEFVLVHEVGHHVHWKGRSSQGLKPLTSREAKEQFADDYAIRYIRAQGGIGYSDRSVGGKATCP